MPRLSDRASMPPLAALVLCAACATNPVTGERQLSLVSESQEIEMGRQGALQAEQAIGLVEDRALQDYVSRIGLSLARDSERPNLPWTFKVVDDPTPNAFALPGGYIFVTRGLLSVMRTEAELASVLGHEIGHVTAKHSVTMISRQQITQLGLGLGMILQPGLAKFGELAGTGMSLLFLKYGRDAERQADDLGFKYALTDGYDIRQMPNVFASLERIGEASGQSPLPTWMASHPYPEERIQRIQQKITALTTPIPTNTGLDAYMARIDNLVYGDNPRQGFFTGTLFQHPDMKFRIQFPQGWQTQNLPQAVMAGSQQQDAVMQLTLAQGTPEVAANAFFAQQGLQSSNVTRQTINGMSAVTGYFQAQTQSGVIAGIAAFITHDNMTFQIIGYTPSARMQNYEGAFRASVGSFNRLTDPAALNVKPNRINIVKITTAMTLDEFNRRYPSRIPIAELALINEVANGSARLPANASVKQVVAAS